MTVTPRISLVAFEDRDPHFIFVAVPDQRGRYLRTDRSVAFVACPQCHAMVGEPCKSRSGDGYSGTTHAWRRVDARKHWGMPADDVLHKPALPDPVPDEWMEPAA
jgi:hypothetical protein